MLFVVEIHVASFGAHQLSFGTTQPPREAMAVVIVVCRAGKDWVGSGSEEKDEEEENEEGDDGREGGSTMPSERR